MNLNPVNWYEGYVHKTQPLVSSPGVFRSAVILLVCLVGIIIICLLSGCREPVWAESIGYSNEQIADAIFKAENSKKHPYGILTKYKTTTPRQACINTIRRARTNYSGEGDFISFLQKLYAPLGVANDPTGLNRNWTKNVKHFLEKS